MRTNGINWLKGFAAAVSGGITSSVAPIIVDPDHFLMGHGAMKKLGLVMSIGAFTHALMYIRQKWSKYEAVAGTGNFPAQAQKRAGDPGEQKEK